MTKRNYVLGVDFGTLSCRALLVEVATGREAACATAAYADGVIDERLPGTDCRLGVDWALQNPDNYLAALAQATAAALQQAGLAADAVIGLGVDFTSCTMLPVTADGEPLCRRGEFRRNPHAWAKLWKHHAAQTQADRLTALAAERREAFLPYYGGRISSEWLLPKIWQVLAEAPAVYAAADRFLEAGDWIVQQLTGLSVRSASAAGYKANWSRQDGYPDSGFLRTLDPGLEQLAATKLRGPVLPVGEPAGGLSAAAAASLGLRAGTPVAVANIDAHAAVPAAGAVHPGDLALIMGTSTCHMMLSRERRAIAGICGVVADGIIPGLYGYEAGQAAVGDMFDWFVAHCVPGDYQRAAAAHQQTIHQWLEQQAAGLLPGESGLLALDWWNGVRTPLVDSELSGLLLGATLQTKPEEIYRALLEATAFGTLTIIETFAAAGLDVGRLVACGGLPEKNRLLMQIYADVTGRDIHVAAATQASALGAAMFGAVAAGRTGGGYATIAEAVQAMTGAGSVVSPLPANVERYRRLYAEYKTIQAYFGRGGNAVMQRLKAWRREARQPAGPIGG